MGIEKTFFMDCDKCGEQLTDRDGLYTSGREQWVIEHADSCLWVYDKGWICPVCQKKKAEVAK